MANEAEQHIWRTALSRRIEAAGLSPLVLPILEVVRTFRLLGSQALLMAQPLLRGVVDDAAVEVGVSLLEATDTLNAHSGEEGDRV